MRHAADSDSSTHRAKAEPGDADSPGRVAKPIMDAVDGMPQEYRLLVHEFGYVDVYRAWRKGWTAAMIRRASADGVFVFRG